MNNRQLLGRSVKRAADAMLIYGVKIASYSAIRVTSIKGDVSAPSYRVRIIFDSRHVPEKRLEELLAYFLSDITYMINRFRLNVSSIYIDHYDGKPYENFKGDRAEQHRLL